MRPAGTDAHETPLALLLGPTASGKSAVAMALAEHLPIEIVSVDSAQVYRGMDIGTAKPGAAERAAVPHHLIDIVDPRESYSAARFVVDARTAIDAIRACSAGQPDSRASNPATRSASSARSRSSNSAAVRCRSGWLRRVAARAPAHRRLPRPKTRTPGRRNASCRSRSSRRGAACCTNGSPHGFAR